LLKECAAALIGVEYLSFEEIQILNEALKTVNVPEDSPVDLLKKRIAMKF